MATERGNKYHRITTPGTLLVDAARTILRHKNSGGN
jgi:hypothetical protein